MHKNNTFSLELVQNYFAHLNPLAAKISRDINDAKLSYGHLWNRFNPIEHNDIINETLIKPEISIRYFDKFSPSSSISKISFTYKGSTLGDSNDSLITDVMKSSNDASDFNNIIQHKNATNQPCHMQYNGYDQRNLCTFAIKKVALKKIHDDVLDAYRDEHSSPFSFKTKSQINLNTFANNEQTNEIVCLLTSVDSEMFIPKPQKDQETLTSYKILQSEFIDHIKEKDFADGFARKNYRFQNDLNNEDKTTTKEIPKNNIKLSQLNLASRFSGANTAKKELLKPIIHSEIPSDNSPMYAIYSDVCSESEESTNLMRKYSVPGFINALSSSTIGSIDQSEEYEDDKTLCEDVKLLNIDISLRKGFEFLNNW